MSQQDQYALVCARCWEGPPRGDWLQMSFPVLANLSSENQDVMSRYLCPGCRDEFPSDQARAEFLSETIPADSIRLPWSRLPRSV